MSLLPNSNQIQKVIHSSILSMVIYSSSIVFNISQSPSLTLDLDEAAKLLVSKSRESTEDVQAAVLAVC